MKFTLQRHIALAAMSAVQQAVQSGGTIAILRNVLIHARDGLVDIVATNLDLQVRHTITDANIETEGAVTVDAAKLKDSVSSLSEGADFSFEFNPKVGETDTRAILRSGRARFQMVTLPAKDFPLLDEQVQGGSGFTIAAADLTRLLTIGSSCAASDKSRPYLNVCFIHQAPSGVLRVVSTDTRRLSWIDKAGVEGIEGWAGVVLATQTTDVVTRLLRNEAPDVMVTMDAVETRVAFGIGRSTVVSKVIAGNYVPYANVIPKPARLKAKLVADTDLMIAALNRAMVMMDHETSKVTLHFEESGVAFTTDSANVGELSDVVAAEYEGDPRRIIVNGVYLKDLLARIRTENVVFLIAENPNCITVNETGDSDMLAFLAPQHG